MKALLYQTKGFCYKENLIIYKLGRSSNVTRVRKSLEQKEIIQSINGETIFIDPILEYWLANYYFDLPLNFDPPIYLKLPAYLYS